MKPYLISLASYTKGVDQYLSSLKNLGDSVEWIDIEFLPYFPEYDGKKILPPVLYPGHLGRFIVLGQLIDSGLELALENWWIFTDTGDVRFQAPIPDLGTEDVIYVTPENIKHKDAEWWAQMARNDKSFEPLMELPVYNMGTVAMKGHRFYEFLCYLKEQSAGFKQNLTHYYDQPIFNFWLQRHMDKLRVKPEFMSCLFDNLGKTVTERDGQYFYSDQLISIVHANGGAQKPF